MKDIHVNSVNYLAHIVRKRRELEAQLATQARVLVVTDPTKLMKDIHVNSANYLAHIVRKGLRPAGALTPVIWGASLLHALRASYLCI
eukprot:jgi/Chrzof1/4109/UNPLg00771.t1